jgi:GxxExxY protein
MAETANHVDDRFLHSDLTDRIIKVFYEVYNELGQGFLEAVYEQAMSIALTEGGLRVSRQVDVPVWFRGRKIGEYRADLLVEDLVVVELKAAKTIESSFEAQLLNYLRATTYEIGLLLNFGLKPGVRRLAFSNERKGISVHQRSSAANA